MKKAVISKKSGNMYRCLHVFIMLVTVFNMSMMGVFFNSKAVLADPVDENLCEADIDIVMVMDRSGSMELGGFPNKLSSAQAAANDFLDLLGTEDQSALVSFSSDAVMNKALSSEHALTQAAVNALAPSGDTNIGDAIDMANTELLSSRARSKAVKVQILLTDGMANEPDTVPDPEVYAEEKAAEAATAGIKIFTIGLGSNVNGTSLQNIADTTGGEYYFAPSQSDLQNIYDQISLKLCEYGSISGCKFLDSDNDGSLSGESVIPVWEFTLGGDYSDTQTTTDGCYSFTGLSDGDYTVTEGSVSGYEQTFPTSNGGVYDISLSEGEDKTEQNFGNYFPSCGNLILDDGEDCEAGDTDDCEAAEGRNGTKTCVVGCEWSSCVPDSSCGDGEINGNEQCDGDNMGNYDDNYICESCTAVYQPYCGDDKIDTPNSNGFTEECDGDDPKSCTTDDGYSGTQDCSSCAWDDCDTDDYCGDDNINGTEVCDDGDDNGTFGYCNADCTGDTPSECGNNVLELPEECDDGVSGSATCTDQCTTIDDNDYCGDGEVNQAWEECDGFDNSSIFACTDQCQFDDDNCSDKVFARVNVPDGGITNGPLGDMTSDIYLGSDSYHFPQGTWFLVSENGAAVVDADVSGYEDVPGFAVERLDGSVRAVLYGTRSGNGNDIKEHIDGNVEFFNATVTGQRDDQSNDMPGSNKLEKGFDGNGVGSYDAGDDEIWVENADDNHSYFWLTTTTADDGFYTDWSIVEDCIDICGDGNLDSSEQCDDGNVADNDGCSSTCTIETSGPECGDGNQDSGEQCDDGNNADNDGCDSQCNIEEDAPRCGDETIDQGEECDYGDTENGDGCDSECQFEPVISGCKYNDANNNGVIDDTELKLSGWEIQLQQCPFVLYSSDSLGSGPIVGECTTYASATTGDDGCYDFYEVDEGQYRLVEVQQSSWTQTLPNNPNYYSVYVGGDGGLENPYNFANYHEPTNEPYCGDGEKNGDEECDGSDGVPSGKTCRSNCTLKGGGGGGEEFMIKNPQLLYSCNDNDLIDVHVTWLTNKFATSRVVYDSDGNSTLGSKPDYGYANTTIEYSDKKTGHDVLITDLEPGTVYYFRPVSVNGNKEVIGDEKFFTEVLTCTGDEPEEIIVLGEEGAPVLVIEKTSNKEFANPGDTIEFEIVVRNTGNITAFDVALVDVLPEGLKFLHSEDMTRNWDLGDIEPGESKTTVAETIVSTDAESKAYMNVATVSATNHEVMSAEADIEIKEIVVLAATGFSTTEAASIVSILILAISGSFYLRRKTA